jgi:uncharacterized membrane protein
MSNLAEASPKLTSRIDSVDLLRGLVMVIMLLDHVREYVHSETFLYSPTDLSKTSAAIFFTRWLTHFCAPTFVFLAGTSIYLQLLRGKSRAELARFLVTRGFWLILLEFTVIRFSIFFNLDYTFFGMAEVIWIFGVAMIVMAGLIYLPVRIVAVCAVAMIAFHNLLDRFSVSPATAFAGTPPPDALQKLWFVLHQPGGIPLFGDTKMFIAYPLIPWVGVMAAGYALGAVYGWEAQRRRKFLFRLGLVLTGLFVVIRAINIYGDPSPWAVQPAALFTFLSFFNTTKYPVSLLFLLMTIGPALILLAAADGIKRDGNLVNKILITFGRVPFFYFILQMFISHGAGVLLSYLAGKDTAYLFYNFPASATGAPPGAGFPLWVVYVVWIAGLIILYPLCLWYSKVKQGKQGFPYSYL